MAAKLWVAANGFMATPKLSRVLRTAVQPLCRFNQFCDIEEAIGKGRGDTFSWNVYGDTKNSGAQLAENDRMPVTTFAEAQASLKLAEFGNSIDYSGLYDELSEHPVKTIIHKTLKNDAARTLDSVAAAQFDATPLALNSTSASAFAYTETGTYNGTATNTLSNTHVKAIVDFMVQDRKIPVYDGENYVCVTTPRMLRPFLDQLETLNSYTSEGWARIMDGEAGRYENMRFVRQTNVAVATGQTGATTLGTGAYFFGADTVTEVVAEPLQLRGKIPDDYGRSQGIAWYYVGNFGITHGVTANAALKQARILKWRSI
jgi:N4-gp56 family major capsid protein